MKHQQKYCGKVCPLRWKKIKKGNICIETDYLNNRIESNVLKNNVFCIFQNVMIQKWVHVQVSCWSFIEFKNITIFPNHIILMTVVYFKLVDCKSKYVGNYIVEYEVVKKASLI